MAKGNNVTLKMLYKNKLVYTKTIAMIDSGKTFDFILKYLEEEELPISRGSLANLKAKLKESRETGVPLADLIDRRKKSSITQVSPRNIEGYKGDSNEVQQVVKVAKQNWWSTDQVLDSIITKGVDSLQYMDVIDLPMLLKAVEMKDRNHASDSHGLSLEAMKQYQLIMQAQAEALAKVLMSYVPEDKQAEAWKELDKQQAEILKDVKLSPEGKKLILSLQKEGINID